SAGRGAIDDGGGIADAIRRLVDEAAERHGRIVQRPGNAGAVELRQPRRLGRLHRHIAAPALLRGNAKLPANRGSGLGAVGPPATERVEGPDHESLPPGAESASISDPVVRVSWPV